MVWLNYRFVCFKFLKIPYNILYTFGYGFSILDWRSVICHLWVLLWRFFKWFKKKKNSTIRIVLTTKKKVGSCDWYVKSTRHKCVTYLQPLTNKLTIGTCRLNNSFLSSLIFRFFFHFFLSSFFSFYLFFFPLVKI